MNNNVGVCVCVVCLVFVAVADECCVYIRMEIECDHRFCVCVWRKNGIGVGFCCWMGWWMVNDVVE